MAEIDVQYLYTGFLNVKTDPLPLLVIIDCPYGNDD
jgi:hypothetical protein